MHINKTAGQSVVKWFALNNVPIRDYQNIYRTFDNQSFYFAIVRNPYDRVASQFFHWRDNLKRIRPEVELNEYVSNISDSSKWLIGGYHPWFHARFNEPCSKWIVSNKIKVFKFEEMDKMKNFFIREFNFKNNFPHINKTKSLKSYKALYNNQSLQIIQEKFKTDFDNFGYEK
jgi:hypothetical protein